MDDFVATLKVFYYGGNTYPRKWRQSQDVTLKLLTVIIMLLVLTLWQQKVIRRGNLIASYQLWMQYQIRSSESFSIVYQIFSDEAVKIFKQQVINNLKFEKPRLSNASSDSLIRQMLRFLDLQKSLNMEADRIHRLFDAPFNF